MSGSCGRTRLAQLQRERLLIAQEAAVASARLAAAHERLVQARNTAAPSSACGVAPSVRISGAGAGGAGAGLDGLPPPAPEEASTLCPRVLKIVHFNDVGPPPPFPLLLVLVLACS